MPPALAELIAFFEPLPEGERRENLIALAGAAERHAPRAGERFDVADVRKDAECSDEVGVFLRAEAGDTAHFAVSLGPRVQTLTRAMAALLCRGLEGAALGEVLALQADFVPRVVGAELVRLRSRTVYYMLARMQEAAKRCREITAPRSSPSAGRS
jgi:cysteine desulfuration protein SufE